MKQKTEIVFEIEESVVVKIRAGFIGLCPECNRLTEMLTTETAAALSGLGEREIFRLIEKAEIHFIEAERIFVCRNSLTNGTVTAHVNQRFIDGGKK
jgi:hypothetical protein